MKGFSVPITNVPPPPPQDGYNEEFQDYVQLLCIDHNGFYRDLVDIDHMDAERIQARFYLECEISITTETAEKLAQELMAIEFRSHELSITDPIDRAVTRLGAPGSVIENWIQTGRKDFY
jgi:hypothetical protein